MVPQRVSSDSDEHRAGTQFQPNSEQPIRCIREPSGNEQKGDGRAIYLGSFGTPDAYKDLGRNIKAAGKAVGKQLDRMGHIHKSTRKIRESRTPRAAGRNFHFGAWLKRMAPALWAAFPRIALAVMLVVGALGRMDRDYYLILRWTAFGVAGYTSYVAFVRNRLGMAWVFFLVALFFNPAVPPPITRESWQVVDLACALFLLLSMDLLPAAAGDEVKVRRAGFLPLLILGVALVGLIALSETLGKALSGSDGSSLDRQSQFERRETDRSASGRGGNGRGGSGRGGGGRGTAGR